MMPFPYPTAEQVAEKRQAALCALVKDMQEARKRHVSTEDQALYLQSLYTIERRSDKP